MAIKAGNFQSWTDLEKENLIEETPPQPIPNQTTITDFKSIKRRNAQTINTQAEETNNIFSKIAHRMKKAVVDKKTIVRQPNMKDAFYRTSKYLEDLTQEEEQ